MSRDSYKVSLIDATGKTVEAHLFDGISAENLREHRQLWLPQLAKENAEAVARGETPPHQDAHWDWSGKVQNTELLLSYRHFAIEREAQAQGLMQIEMVLHLSRIEPGKHLVYVDFLSVAPWNRETAPNGRKYKLVGSLLIAQAVGTSQEEGFEGRIGLHSLPRACSWYRDRLKMKPFGPDANYHNLEYFEFSIKDAARFIERDAPEVAHV